MTPKIYLSYASTRGWIYTTTVCVCYQFLERYASLKGGWKSWYAPNAHETTFCCCISQSLAIHNYWKKIPHSHTVCDLNFKYTINYPFEISLSRLVEAHNYAALAGHGGFARHHEWHDHTSAYLYYSCGSLNSPDHFAHFRNSLNRHLRCLYRIKTQ